MTLDDDLLLEGEPETEFVPGIAATFPRKRVAAAALITDGTGRLLLLEQPYRTTLGLPGGVVESGEAPADAVRREVLEELGLDRPAGRLLVVDWVPRHGVWGDSLQFVFDGGVLDDVSGLTLQAGEVDAAVFLTPADAAGRVRPSLARRLHAALDALATGTTAYLQFGRPHPTP